MQQEVKSIEPLPNRLVLFLNSDTSYHGVPGPTRKERKAVLWNFLQDSDKSVDLSKKRAMFVRRRNIDGDVVGRQAMARVVAGLNSK